jgi:hypothetical protein
MLAPTLLALLPALAPAGRGGHVKHLTFYDFVPGEQHSFCTEGLGGHNITALVGVWKQYQLPSILDVEDLGGSFDKGLYYRGGINSTHLNPRWKALIDGVLSPAALPHFGSDKAIRGVFLGDEPCCGGLPVSELAELATYVKAKLAGSGAYVYVNECERSFVGLNPGSHGCPKGHQGNCPYPGLITKVPDAIDFISADIYEENKGWEANAVRKVYENSVYPALAAHQRTWVVPGTFAPITMDNATNSKIMVEKISGFWDWLQNDTRVVGINPWHWNTWGSFEASSPFKMGAREFPRVRAKLQEIGAIIKRNQGGGYGGRGRRMPWQN